MALQISATNPEHPALLLSLPWDTPLEEWHRGTPRTAPPRHLPARGALRARRRRGDRRQGAGGTARAARVRAAARPGPAGHPRRRPARRGHRPHRRLRRPAGAGARHPASARLDAVPVDVRDDHASGDHAPADGRPRGAAGPSPPGRVRLGRPARCPTPCSGGTRAPTRPTWSTPGTGELHPRLSPRAAGLRPGPGPRQHQRGAAGPGGVRRAAPVRRPGGVRPRDLHPLPGGCGRS